MKKEEQVILVNQEDVPIGAMGKQLAHEKGLLHRAFSIFILNDKRELMIQKRGFDKYHSPGLWSNTCCSHQRVGESTEAAAVRRLREEMGFDCEVEKKFTFIYQADLGLGMKEYELDHVLIGYYNGKPNINKEEVEDWKWMKLNDLEKDIVESPQKYTVWFKIIFKRFQAQIAN